MALSKYICKPLAVRNIGDTMIMDWAYVNVRLG